MEGEGFRVGEQLNNQSESKELSQRPQPLDVIVIVWGKDELGSIACGGSLSLNSFYEVDEMTASTAWSVLRPPCARYPSAAPLTAGGLRNNRPPDTIFILDSPIIRAYNQSFPPNLAAGLCHLFRIRSPLILDT
jgi:hypothetical protein